MICKDFDDASASMCVILDAFSSSRSSHLAVSVGKFARSFRRKILQAGRYCHKYNHPFYCIEHIPLDPLSRGVEISPDPSRISASIS